MRGDGPARDPGTAVILGKGRKLAARSHQHTNMQPETVGRSTIIGQLYGNAEVTNKGGSYLTLNYWEKRLNAAQRGFLRASKSLVRIRKLNVLVMLVNQV